MWSFDQLKSVLAAALMAKFGSDAFGTALYLLQEAFPDYVIACGPDQQLFRINYQVNSDDGDLDVDDITLSDPQQVEVAYVPVAQEAQFLVTEAGIMDDGWTWPVQIIKAGPAAGAVDGQAKPHIYTPAVVAEFASAVNEAPFGRRHPSSNAEITNPERVAGWFSGGHLVGEAACANLHLLKTEEELRGRFMAAREAKKPNLFNLSVLAAVGFKAAKVNGQTVLESEKLGKLFSVDLCTHGGAGGKFLTVAESRGLMSSIFSLQQRAIRVSPGTAGNHGSAQGAGRLTGAQMKPRIKTVIEALRIHDAGRATQFAMQLETIEESKQTEFLATVSEALAASITSQTTQPTKEMLALVEESKKLQTSNLVDRLVKDSKLPSPGQKLVRSRFKNQIVEEAEVADYIKEVRESLASTSPVGRFGSATVTIGLESTDKVQLGLDKILGVKESMADKSGPAFRGVKEAYVFITGDSDFSFGQGGRGGFLKVSEATALTTDFPNLLLNSMTKRLLQDYAEMGMNGLDMLVTIVTGVNDFKSQDRVRMGYLGDLSTVTEDSGYTDFAKPTDEKISYTPSKRGNTFPISRETILNDDLQKIAAIPSRIARASRRSLKQFISNFLINNPTYGPDSLALFHASHSNLGSNPLSIDELVAREIALFNQTEKDSGKPLGLTLDWLVVPINLKAVAYQINQAQFYNPGPAIQVPNPFYQRFGVNNERIIVLELLTDTNDWYYGTMPANAPFLEIGFVQDQREPVILLQNDPQAGAVFTNDRITYKARHEYGGAPVDYRPAGKNVVP